MEDIRIFIAREIYIKTGFQPYLSKYLPLILLNIGYYEIRLSINYENRYITIDIFDEYYNTHDKFKKSYDTYEDVENIIDNVFKYIKPSKKY